MKNFIRGLCHESLWVRTGYAFMFFFTFLALAYAFGYAKGQQMTLLKLRILRTLAQERAKKPTLWN